MSNLKATYEFAVLPSDITISRSLIERVLGYRITPEIISHLIDELLPQVPEHLTIRCGFAILPAEKIQLHGNAVSCNGTRFSTGSIIAKRLRKSRSLAVFAATIGPLLEKWSRELMSGDETLRGFIVDTIGSEVVEHVAGWLERKLAEIVQPRGWRITNRYSPGYCGWSVADQQKLFSFLPVNFCGIVLTPSSLMVPIKSVSGVIGLGPDVKREDYECSICDMEDCFRRGVEANDVEEL